MAGARVTPWEVSGKVDYTRLVRVFGTRFIGEDLYRALARQAPLPVLLRRRFFFSHRGLDEALRDARQGKGFFLYTGRAPSGPMHIGHVLPFLMARWFQKAFNTNLYIQIPDEEKFLARAGMAWEEAEAWVEDNLLDIAALGFDEDKTFLYQDTEYIGHVFRTACRVAKKINLSTVKAVFGFSNQSNIGIAFYPALQIVPTLFEKRRCLIPAAIDQDPYWRVQRDIAESLGHPKAAQIHCRFLPPLTGPEGKMSSSEEKTAICLGDEASVVRKKIYKYAFSGGQPSVQAHREKGGNPDIDVAFQWLRVFFEPDDARLEEIRAAYASGALLTGELKDILIEKLNAFLAAHQRKKKRAKKALEKLKYEGALARSMWERKEPR